MSITLQITTIKPTFGNWVSFKPRNKEGEQEKPEAFVTFDWPSEINQIQNVSLRTFAANAYRFALTELLKETVRNARDSVSLPALNEFFAQTGREFLITKKDLEDWLDGFALPLISAAISAKSGFHADSPKVVKKVLAYRELMLAISSRSIMSQEQIDSSIKVLELVAASGKSHSYTDNVAQGIERKQSKLNDWLNGQSDSEDEIDF